MEKLAPANSIRAYLDRKGGCSKTLKNWDLLEVPSAGGSDTAAGRNFAKPARTPNGSVRT